MRSIEPQDISPTAWYYEGRRSLLFVAEVRDKDGTYHGTTTFCVGVTRLLKSLKRMGALPKRRVKSKKETP